MGSINFNNLKNAETSTSTYTYSDVHLDMTEKPSHLNRPEGDITKSNKDIKIAYDINAISNSMVNLFNTVPGQRFLLPSYGCDLRQFIFEPISDFRASGISRTIRTNLDQWEPRVTLVSINVKGVPDRYEYIIDMALQVPFLKTGQTLGLSAVLNRQGFAING